MHDTERAPANSTANSRAGTRPTTRKAQPTRTSTARPPHAQASTDCDSTHHLLAVRLHARTIVRVRRLLRRHVRARNCSTEAIANTKATGEQRKQRANKDRHANKQRANKDQQWSPQMQTERAGKPPAKQQHGQRHSTTRRNSNCAKRATSGQGSAQAAAEAYQAAHWGSPR